MRRPPRTSPFIALLVALAFMVGGLYVCVHPRWFVWGVVLMALGLALAARCLYLHLMQGLETATQINLLHESRILSGDYGAARLGNATRKGRSVARDAENLFSPWRLSVGERGFPVLSPDEIGRLPEHEQLIAIAGQPVIRAKKLPYFADPVWAKRAAREKNSSPAPRPAPARAG